jgi:O-antigen/teichoic acid export membrane protein
MWNRLAANFALQGLNLLGKALLVFLLVRRLPVNEVGEFGLLTTTQSLAMFVLGLGFNAYSVREILQRKPEQVPPLLRDQLVLHGLAYVVVLPALLGVFAAGVIPWGLAGWFYALVVLDHIAQEVHRVLVTLSRATRATFLLFLRHAAWIYLLAGLAFFAPAVVTLRAVLGAWAAGEAAALVLSAYWLRDLPWAAALRTRVDWAWLRRGLTVAAPLLGSTLAYTAMYAADRYALESFRGTEEVGVYTFYGYVRNAIVSLLEIGLVSLIQPRVVAAYQRGDAAEYGRLMHGLLLGLLGLSGLLCAAAALLLGPVVRLIDKPVYGDYPGAFGLVLAFTIAGAVVNVPLLALYARHRDRQTLLACLAGLGVAVAANLLLVPPFGPAGAAAATLCGFVSVGAGSLLFLRVKRDGSCASPSS